MRTVGEILKEEREKKFYTLLEVEKSTKIRKEFLQALEDGNYKKLPPATFVKGFIKNYSQFLGLDNEKLLAIYRREFSEVLNPPKILESFSNPIERNRFNITPAKFLGVLILSLVIIFFGYLWFEYRFLIGQPFLEVSSPDDQIKVESENIIVSGRADPESKVSINNQEIEIDATGKFFQKIKLTESVNKISIVAVSKNNKSTKIEKTVFLKE